MSAPDFNTLMEFEDFLEAAFETWLNSNEELNLLGTAAVDSTPGSEGAADQFQKARPRVECFVTVGAPVGNPPHFVLDVNGVRRENGWHATVELAVITAAEPKIHRAYRAGVRNVMASADDVLVGSNDYLPWHEVTQCFSAGSSRTLEPEKGTFLTHLTYDIIFAIQPSAWPGGLWNGTLSPPPSPGADAARGYPALPLIDAVTGQLVTLTIKDGVITIAE